MNYAEMILPEFDREMANTRVRLQDWPATMDGYAHSSCTPRCCSLACWLMVVPGSVLPQLNLEERSVWVSITPMEVRHDQAAPPLRRYREGRHPQTPSPRQGPDLGPVR